MLPFGDAKGSALALMIEILAAGITGANFAYQADSFLDADGDPPNVGQLLIMINPAALGSKKIFFNKINDMISSILAQKNTYLPGSRRSELREKAYIEGLSVDDKLMNQIKNIV